MKKNLRKLLAVLLSLTLLGGPLTVLAEAPEEPVVVEEPEPMPEAVPEPAPEVPAEPIPEPPAEPVPEAPEVPPVDDTEMPPEPPAEPEGTAVPEAPDTDAPCEPEASAPPTQDPSSDPEAPAEPLLPAEALSAGLGVTVEELAAGLGVSVEELLLMDEETLNALCAQAHADEYSVEPIADEYGFGIDENGVLTKYTGPGGAVVIPDTVKKIGDRAFENCATLTSVVIPSGVTDIGNSAFQGCSILEQVEMPSTLTSIGYNAFYGCTLLPTIDIPSGVTSIGSHAFSNCESLTGIVIPSGVQSIEDGTFEYCKLMTSVELPSGLTSIGQNAFMGCEALPGIKIPASVTSIESGAFQSCKALKSIEIPEGVTSIEDSTFSLCSSLESVTIPATVTSIGQQVFTGCSALKSIQLPPNITIIRDSTFSGCGNLTGITIPSGVKYIGEDAFYFSGLSGAIDIPASVITIGANAFSYCNSLNRVTLYDTVTQIGAEAFSQPAFAEQTEIVIYAENMEGTPYAEQYCVDNDLTYIKVPHGTDVLDEPPAAPAVQLSVNERTLTASWEPVEGAARYEYSLQNLTDHAGDGVMLHDHEAVTGELSVTVTELEPGKYYRLQVWAIPEYGDSVKYPAFCGLYDNNSVPVALSDPPLQVTLNGTTMSASWDNVDGAASYVCTVKHISQYYGEELIVDHEPVTGTLSYERALEAGRRYSFQVGAVPEGISWEDEPELCGWSEEEFDIKLDDPVISCSVKANLLTATWESIEGAEMYVYSIWDMTDDAANGVPIAENVMTYQEEIFESLELDKSYKLRVGAVPEGLYWYDYPEVCGWGEVAFETQKPLAAPEVSVTVDGTMMKATWQAVEGAADYVCSIWEISNGEDIIVDHESVADSLSFEYELQPGGQYKLQVGAVPEGLYWYDHPDVCGWGEATFEIQKPPAAPEVSITIDGTTMTATWQAVGGAASYVYYLYCASTGELLRDHVPVGDNGLSVTESLTPGEYYQLWIGALPEGISSEDAANYSELCGWGEYEFYMEFIDAYDITLSLNQLTLGAGETAQLTYELQPSDANVAVTFESGDRRIATVDASGLVRARNPGRVNIKARTATGLVAKCTVIVKAAPAKVVLDRAELTLSVGQEGKLTATLPNGSAGTLRWESDDEGVATVDAGGKVTAISVGNANVTVTAYNYDESKPRLRKSCAVTVEGEPASVDAGVTDVTLGVGEKLKLVPTVKDADGEAITNFSLSYKSDDTGVAVVNVNGKIAAVKAGTTTITVTANNGPTATVNVSVKAAPKRVEITNNPNKLGVGEAWTIGAKLTGKGGAESAGKVTFSSSNAKVLGVNADTGALNAKAAGSAKITAKAYNGASAAINVTVKAAPKEIKLDKSTLTMGVDEPDIKLTASFRNANQFGHVTWISDAENIVTVDRGLLTALTPGVANITASVYNPAGGNFTAQCKVTVKAKPTADKMTLSLPRGTIGVGEKLTATLTYADDVGGAYKFASSNKNVATVNAVNGKVRGVKAGKTVTISAEAYNGARVEQQIEVVAAPTKVEFEDAPATMNMGETLTLSVIVSAGKADVTGKVGVTYSSNKPDIIEVNTTTGDVSARAPGAGRITVTTYNGISTTVRIVVQ